MKIITEGHSYLLKNFEDPQSTQQLHFIHKEQIENLPDLKTVNEGTTNEEVLQVLIDRMKYLQNKFPCRENAIVITKLEESLMWLNKRTADRVSRKVEGKHLK